MTNIKKGRYGGTFAHPIIVTVTDGMLNLTSLWKACGGDKSNQPHAFLRSPATEKIMIALVKKSKAVNITALTNIKKGRYGGNFAHPIIGLAYAKYLSPEFHIWCNDVLVTCNTLK
ncbi:KilA-N domain-containing protein [Pseudodesulfovibrio nedwellii]|uniref:KilA-N domain-containing protein n=1 Tax=Pseudodesulfovibrio nedwellii TaxID=2973072 RepID=UPI002491031C|nr:KilA-N domain-containing protein [Pseudodesulfovibrio nedwellii]